TTWALLAAPTAAIRLASRTESSGDRSRVIRTLSGVFGGFFICWLSLSSGCTALRTLRLPLRPHGPQQPPPWAGPGRHAAGQCLPPPSSTSPDGSRGHQVPAVGAGLVCLASAAPRAHAQRRGPRGTGRGVRRRTALGL